MTAFALLLSRHQTDSGKFELAYGFLGLTIIAVWTLWDRRYKRIWQDYRSRGWSRIEGQFDEGEVIPMRRGRSKTIAGYEVWLGYEYKAEGDQAGVYRLPRGTKGDAEEAMRKLANQRIIVRVSPRNSTRSHVSDEDISFL